MYDERNHQDALRWLVFLAGAEDAKRMIPNETERQDNLKCSAYYELWKPRK
jgi:hypothetical protein